MRVAVTGAAGFLGWHTRCALQARGLPTVALGRGEPPAATNAALVGADAVLHLAGVNRGSIAGQNVALARALTQALDRTGARPAVIYANSIQAGNGSEFGDDKQAAADHLLGWGRSADAPVADVCLPNLFGEHGRPHYNSVVATFCHDLVNDRRPVVDTDRVLPLLHVQDAVDVLIGCIDEQTRGTVHPAGRPLSVAALAARLTDFHQQYSTGTIPDVADALDRALFNTFRSFCFPQSFPMRPSLRADDRGRLFDCVRAQGGPAQVFASTTHPGHTRGQHFHLRKIERFLVLQGSAEIAVRRLFDDTVVRFAVSGGEPAIVDMPTMWAHSITNTGDTDLLTLFWADELLNPLRPDTYPEPVAVQRVSA